MKLWAGDEVSSANLNSTFEADAYVVDGATPNGAVYSTIQSAINAGKKSILVAPGEHAAFDLPASALGTGVAIRGERPAISNPSAGECARVVGQCSVYGDHNQIVDLAWKDESSHSVIVRDTAAHNLIHRCTMYDVGTGFRFSGQGVGNRFSYNRVTLAGNGMILAPAVNSYFCYVTVDHNYIDQSEGQGILVGNSPTDDDVVGGRKAFILSNHIQNSGDQWSAPGIRVENRSGAIIRGNIVRNGGTASIYSDGILVDSPVSGTMLTTVIGNFVSSNYGVGIRVSGSATASVVVAANICYGNTVGQYSGLASSPGYVTGSYGTNG